MDHATHERGERRETGFACFALQAVCGELGCSESLSGVRAQAAELECLQVASAGELKALGRAVVDRAFKGEL